MAAHVYWRINVSANAGDNSFLSIAEIEMHATVGGADQCNAGIASASSAEGSAPVSNGFDNDNTTRWATTANVLTGWIQYQFPAAVEVVEYTIRAHPTSPLRSPKDWTLEYSDDGTAWTVVDTPSGFSSWTNGEVKTLLVPSPGTPTAVLSSQTTLEVLRQNLEVSAQVSQVSLEVLRTNTNVSAELSQVSLEVLRQNLEVSAQVSQVYMEVLRPNVAEMPDGRPYVFSST